MIASGEREDAWAQIADNSVGECPGGAGPDAFVLYSKPENKELQMVFNFHQ
jgi:hypothetical protein